jgi:hypothetical protein
MEDFSIFILVVHVCIIKNINIRGFGIIPLLKYERKLQSENPIG